MDIAKEMIGYRSRNGLSQEKLAKLMGMTLGGINKIENGWSTARATTIYKMQQLLDSEKK